jgi:uncharacterized protein (DUF2236 family)
VIEGAALLASTANAVMQLALPGVGYGVLESKVEPFREQMRLPRTEGDQRQFEVLIRIVATAYRLLPAPVARFPFNASLHELRLRMMRDRLRKP